MRIGSREIGTGHTFVIAEIGSNHDGAIARARDLIRAAGWAGADAVKFQLWDPDKMYARGTDAHAAARKHALPVDWLPVLAAAARDEGVEFLCSAFDRRSLEAVDPFVPAHKIASIEASWTSYRRLVRAKGKPVLVSLGLHEKSDPVPIGPLVIPLACTTAYPCPLDQANVARVRELVRLHGRAGYSDHTTETFLAPVAAVAMGACVIEKHITDDRRRDGPDHAYATQIAEFAWMVQMIRETEKAIGDGVQRIMPSEEPYRGLRRGRRGLRGA